MVVVPLRLATVCASTTRRTSGHASEDKRSFVSPLQTRENTCCSTSAATQVVVASSDGRRTHSCERVWSALFLPAAYPVIDDCPSIRAISPRDKPAPPKAKVERRPTLAAFHKTLKPQLARLDEAQRARGVRRAGGSDVSVRRYLSEAAEREVLRLLNAQLGHEQRVTTDDVRLAVRTVASGRGTTTIPSDFPPSRWVLAFKRQHGFVQPNSFTFEATVARRGGRAGFGLPKRLERTSLRPVQAQAQAQAQAEAEAQAQAQAHAQALVAARPRPLLRAEPHVDSERAPGAATSSSSNDNHVYRDHDIDDIDDDDHSNYNYNGSMSMCNGDSSSIREAHGEASSDEDEEDEELDEDSGGSLLPMLSETAMAYSGPRAPVDGEGQAQQPPQPQYFGPCHRAYPHQSPQQRRARIADDYPRAVVNGWPMPRTSESAAALDERRHRLSWEDLSSERGSTATMSYRMNGDDADVGPGNGTDESCMLPHLRPGISESGRSLDDMQDLASNASSYNCKRNYKLSHTVPAETWEKAIAAVEQRGMSLRAAAKMYGVHFAALHRRVKKRAQGSHANGTDRYFHPSDEAGIMRVVVAHAELGVLMTFDELMRLVEAAALRKLPDISVKSARKLLTRFQSRNAQSIRHIIEDWPPPLPVVDPNEGMPSQPQPYLEHPGFTFASESPPALLSSVATESSTGARDGDAATTAAVAATSTPRTSESKSTVLVSPSRRHVVTRRHELSHPTTSNNGRLPGLDNNSNRALSVAPSERMRFVSPRTRSPGDNDPVLVV
ncbi:unnamed protein product [Hyaloperonospora brassicae]|uniref:HTH psq-type domain-containing protein n=1 Tax=Hyaloperonospora brassicae TaxID=162125 RepID=A0AAV0UAY8_HYABA|nr:unnamed protein product [Hyaloperonospora brassicae]